MNVGDTTAHSKKSKMGGDTQNRRGGKKGGQANQVLEVKEEGARLPKGMGGPMQEKCVSPQRGEDSALGKKKESYKRGGRETRRSS